MTREEQELAAELQAGRGDLDEWGNAVPEDVRSERRARLGAMVSVRLSEVELAELQERAKENGESVSALIRRLVLQGMEAQRGARHRANLVSLSTTGSFYVSRTSAFVAVEGPSSFTSDSSEGTSFVPA